MKGKKKCYEQVEKKKEHEGYWWFLSRKQHFQLNADSFKIKTQTLRGLKNLAMKRNIWQVTRDCLEQQKITTLNRNSYGDKMAL